MEATTWQIISIVGFSLFAVFLIATVFMFVKMNIPAIIGDLTGKTAEKQIQEIREQNQRTGNKRYQPSAFNLERGELTEPVKKSRKLGKTQGATGGAVSVRMSGVQTDETSSKPIVLRELEKESFPVRETAAGGTVNLESMDSGDMHVLDDDVVEVQKMSDATQVLVDGTQVLVDGTQVLADGTQVLADGTQVLADGTQVLKGEMVGATTEAQPTEELVSKGQVKEEINFKIVKDVKIVHTDEMI